MIQPELHTERRLEKIEERFDNLKEDLGELKTDLKLHMHVMEKFMQEHKETIQELKPIVEEYNFEELRKKKKRETLKKVKLGLSLATIVGGAIIGSFRFLSNFFGNH